MTTDTILEPRPGAGGDRPEDPPLPLIRVTAGELPRVVDEAEEALLRANPGLYQRGNLIVRPVSSKIAIADGGETVGHRLSPARTAHIVECLTRTAQWEKWDGRAMGYVRSDCPQRVAETYMARDGQWRLPVLAGVINAPTLRPDGSLLDAPGYDAATGLLLDPGGAVFPPLPPEPTREEAERGLQLLEGLIGTFPFVGDSDRAVALSGILTATIRRSLPTAPAHCYTAPVPGSGKTTQVDLAAIIATGRPA